MSAQVGVPAHEKPSPLNFLVLSMTSTSTL
jgi:hypothetical protein